MAQAQDARPAMPNGATALNETYQDWQVRCSTSETQKICVLTQQQRKSDTNQLVLAAEFTSITPDLIRGAFVLPFGLRLADGITLQIDDGAIAKLPFTTCLPAGCIADVSFDVAQIKALRSGKVLKLAAQAHDSGQVVNLAVSLNGFTAAHDRAALLSSQ